jgi:Fic family protein
MNMDELKAQFLVDDEVQVDRLARLVEKALQHCVVHKGGTVEVRDRSLPGKDQVKLVLSARLLASKLEESLSGDVTVEEIAKSTDLPKNQVAARAKECLDERFAERTTRGSYKARALKVEEFLDTLSKPKGARHERA